MAPWAHHQGLSRETKSAKARHHHCALDAKQRCHRCSRHQRFIPSTIHRALDWKITPPQGAIVPLCHCLDAAPVQKCIRQGFSTIFCAHVNEERFFKNFHGRRTIRVPNIVEMVLYSLVLLHGGAALCECIYTETNLTRHEHVVMLSVLRSPIISARRKRCCLKVFRRRITRHYQGKKCWV